MKKLLLLFAALSVAALIPLTAQKIDWDDIKGVKARSIGPAGMSGRITSIDVDLSNDHRIIAGAASGGLWLSESGGIDWKPIFDDAPLQAIGSVKINQANPSEIWVGTGEGNPRNSLNQGGGIYKTIDGGKNWKLMGLEKTKSIHRIIIHKDNPNVVYAGASGSTWGKNKERGVYRTKDGGKTWDNILYVNDGVGVADMVADPTNPNKILVAMWEHGRKPWTFNSGGPGSGLYLTYDGGDTWKKITAKEGLPKGDLGRIGIAIAPSKPNVIYALVEAKVNGLYKSVDGGEKWSLVSTKNIGGRPFYYSEIYVDPLNENRIWNIHTYVDRSEDGGKTFKQLLDYAKGVHPDHHAFWIHPTNPHYMIDGNDGGLNISRDRGENWRFVTNIPVGQFYHINYDMDYPYNVMGGLQDNGSWVGPAYVLKAGGIRNADWREVYFGDGFDIMPHPSKPDMIWAMSQGGFVSYFNKQTREGNFVRPVHPDGTFLRMNWNAALAQDPFNDCGAYFGSQFVHKSKDCGQSWDIISPDLTTDDKDKQKTTESGGLTIDDTQAEKYTTILAIAPSPHDENTIWAATDDGNLQLTRDGGKTWNNLSSKLPGFVKGSWIPQIELSTTEAGTAYVAVNDYRRNNWKPYAYVTKDYGQTWRRIADESQIGGHVWSILPDPEVPNLLFLGTEVGLYISVDAGANWTKYTNGYPSVPTADMKIHPREHDLILGTFGRAIYILDDIRPLREIARTKGAVLKQDLKVFEAPEAFQNQYRSVDGVRFTADAEFSGENRRRGAMVTIWNKPPAKEKKTMTTTTPAKKKKVKKEEEDSEEIQDTDKKSGKKPKKANIYVMDMAGDTIRSYTTKIDTGLTRIYWNMSEDGVRFPSYNIPKEDADTPSGAGVLPGTYKFIVKYGDHKDSTMIKVNHDPRSKVTSAELAEKQKITRAYYRNVERAAEAMQRLNESLKTIKLVDSQMTNAQDSIKKMIVKEGKTVADSIKTLQRLYAFPPGTKGIQRDPLALNSVVSSAARYIGGSMAVPGANSMHSVAYAEKEIDRVVSIINNFYDTKWKEYRKMVEDNQSPIFKDYDM